MKTDWKLIREVMNAALDSCEGMERIGYAEQHRGLSVEVNGQRVTVQDFIVSAWTIAEHARYQVIRQRHEKDLDLRYIPETARILIAVAAACAELVGAGEAPPAEDFMRGMVYWYRNHFDPNLKKAIA